MGETLNGLVLLTFIEQTDEPIHLLLESFHSRGGGIFKRRKEAPSVNDRLSEVSNMPTKEQKPLLGTKGTRQGPQTLADLSTPLLIWVSYTKERNTGHRHPLRGDQQVSSGFTNMNASQLCGYTPYWKEERERREFLKGEDYKG